jgi:hypothetical protein
MKHGEAEMPVETDRVGVAGPDAEVYPRRAGIAQRVQ